MPHQETVLNLKMKASSIALHRAVLTPDCFLRMVFPTIVFDLDGTLVDTAPDLVATLNAVFAREGFAPVAYESARNMVGRGARAMIERGLAAQRRHLPAGEIERLFRDFIAHYGAHIADHSRPFAGVETALDELAARGCRLAVCTNKLEHLSVQLLDALGLVGRFATICGQDTFAMQKPDPEMLRRTIERAGGHADMAVMVGGGDRRGDCQCGQYPCGCRRLRLQRGANSDLRSRLPREPLCRCAGGRLRPHQTL
jgi:phosphoglycolate phosphatase